MEMLRIPHELKIRGIQWPEVLVVGKDEPAPEVGLPYIRAEKQDFDLIFRVMLPLLQDKYPNMNWETIYRDITGMGYRPVDIFEAPGEGKGNHAYSGSGHGSCTTIQELAKDLSANLDMNVLMDMRLIPTFFVDIAQAIKVNITNNFIWNDGYNKKTKLCTGTLVEQPRERALVILDVSSSIPAGLSAGMLTMIKTITDITHADLIITAGDSYFFTNEEVRRLDIDAMMSTMPRGNERDMFVRILESHNMNYQTVIVFGDTDHPGHIELSQLIKTKRLYSYFVSRYDRYGASYQHIAGYGRWVQTANPDVEVIHNTSWARYFNKSY